jgi:hypothetical protein
MSLCIDEYIYCNMVFVDVCIIKLVGIVIVCRFMPVKPFLVVTVVSQFVTMRRRLLHPLLLGEMVCSIGLSSNIFIYLNSNICLVNAIFFMSKVNSLCLFCICNTVISNLANYFQFGLVI